MSLMLKRGLIVAVIHTLMVASLGAKLLIDRSTRPRVWARAAPVDPDLPIRGRYVRLRIEGRFDGAATAESQPVVADAVDGALVFRPVDQGESALTARPTPPRDGHASALLLQPLAFFIPEHVPDPSIRADGEELWVEVTLPRRGTPRPIRLGLRQDGVLTPLDLD